MGAELRTSLCRSPFPGNLIRTAGLVSGKIALTLAMQPNVEWNVDHSFANIRIEKKIGQ